MNLPEIKMIGLQPVERLLEHPQRKVFVAPMGADLSHQKNLIAFALEGAAQPDFGLSAMILPAVIEECDAAVDRSRHNFFGCFLIGGIAKMMAA